MRDRERAEPFLGDIQIDPRETRGDPLETREPPRGDEGYDWLSITCFAVAWALALIGAAALLLGIGLGTTVGGGEFGFSESLAAGGTITAAVAFAWMGHVHHHLRMLVQLAKPG